jgi:CBS domain-containing protein
MTPKVLTVRDELSLHELADFLAENQITGAPVLDRKGHFVGVVSATDIAEAETEGADWTPGDGVDSGERRGLHVETAGRQVRDIMTPTLYTVDEGTPASELARTMVTGRVHRLFVTRKGRIVGIVTSLDLLKLLVVDTHQPDDVVAPPSLRPVS